MLKSFYFCFWFLAIAFVGSTTSLEFQCNPTLDCMNAVAGDKVPNPNDCNSYYICIKSGSEIVPSDITFQCPEGQCFDDLLEDCATESSTGRCSNNVCCNLPPGNSCNTTCAEFNFETVAYVGNCSQYYVCSPSGPVLLECRSPNLYYNGDFCGTDINECCDFCTAFCLEAFTEVPDPYDCTKYYFCMDAGPVDEVALSESCSDGEYFDPEISTCVIGNTCNNVCVNSIKNRLDLDEYF